MAAVILIAVFIIIKGAFRAREEASSHINLNKIKILAERGDVHSAAIKECFENPDKPNDTIKVCSLLLSGMACACAVFEPAGLFYKKLGEAGLGLSDTGVYAVSLALSLLLVLYLLLVFGEYLPRRIGARYPEETVYFFIAPIGFFGTLLNPLSAFSSASASVLSRLFRISGKNGDEGDKEEEIRTIIDVGEDSGLIEPGEKEMINNIIEFSDTSVEDIATHRTDIVAISASSGINDICETVNNEKYSRIPVYNENIDDIVGILHVKDFVKYIINHGTDGSDFDIYTLLLKPHFVPTSKKIDDLFKEMQKDKVHMAIVIDEYGGTAGLVTMEDLIEEIMGNIFDEYDEEEEEDIEIVDKDTLLVKGTASLEDVEEILGVQFELHDDYDTIGGLLIGLLDRIPEDGEKPEIKEMGYVFKVEKIEEKRIESVRIRKEA